MTDVPESVRAALDSLRDLGGDDLVKQMVSVFIEYSAGRVKALDAAAEAGDLHAMAEAAHALKGSSRQLGLAAMADACLTVETAAKQGNLGTARAMAPSVSHTYQIAAQVLQAAIA